MVLIWEQMADSPIVRHEAQGVVVGGKLYAFGGYTYGQASQYAPTRRVDVYNPETNTWRRLADMPNGLSHGGITAVDDNIYIAGGYPLSDGGQSLWTNLFWKYSISEDKWYIMPSMPKPNGGGDLEALGRKLHYIGGAGVNRVDTDEHWVFDLDNPEAGWVQKASTGLAVNHVGGVALNGKLYMIGGQQLQDAQAKYPSSTPRVYDPVADRWTRIASLPKGRSHMHSAVFAWRGKIWMIGGEPTSTSRDVLTYDPTTNTWSAVANHLPLKPNPKTAQSGFSSTIAGVINDQIYFATGSTTKVTYRGRFVPISQTTPTPQP